MNLDNYKCLFFFIKIKKIIIIDKNDFCFLGLVEKILIYIEIIYIYFMCIDF